MPGQRCNAQNHPCSSQISARPPVAKPKETSPSSSATKARCSALRFGSRAMTATRFATTLHGPKHRRELRLRYERVVPTADNLLTQGGCPTGKDPSNSAPRPPPGLRNRFSLPASRFAVFTAMQRRVSSMVMAVRPNRSRQTAAPPS